MRFPVIHFFLRIPPDSTDNRRLNDGHSVPHGGISIPGDIAFVPV
jgi:hypothetical protein